MDIRGVIFNGYLRLYCKIFEIPGPPKRCRWCGGELDDKFKARHAGYLCLECYKKQSRVRATARYNNPMSQLCQYPYCKEQGHRHHNDYDEPKDVEWLCPKHHSLKHKKY